MDDDVAAAPRNNFDALRILAALSVAVSHGFALTTGSDAAEPVFRLSDGQATLGKIAVCVFFVISGYLIPRSFLRTRDPRSFVRARALRLLPALAVMLLVVAFLAGPLLSTWPARAYFADATPYWHVALNLSLLDSTDRLPGVFGAVPYRWVVDGSLWTLPVEARCYAVVLLLGVCGLLNRVAAALLLGATLALAKLWLGGEAMWFYACFAGGMVMCLWHPPLDGRIATLCAALCVVALLVGGFRIASATFGAYLTLYIALSPRIRLPDLARFGDISYGVYIWSFPVQQLVAEQAGGVWWINIAVSFPLFIGLAYASWWGVEAPALVFKRVRG